MVAVDSPPSASGNVPFSLSTFVGREDDTSQVIGLLGDARLVTLTGPPGIGKTRLGTETAQRVGPSYTGGVWLVHLASVPNTEAVSQVVSSVLGTGNNPNPSGSNAALAARIGNASMLVLLDNCEHLIGGCAALADDLLGSCPGLTILATSQEPLGVLGEQVWPVPPLALPDHDTMLTATGLHGSEPPGSELPGAIRLFVDRAGATRPGFALTEEIAPSVLEICRRLDGIPLAIELAAAMVATLSAPEIVRRLDDRFALLTQGTRTALPRHQTLRAAVDWSYELLSPPERTLLSAMSVFAGGATLEAVETVCSSTEAEVSDTLSLMTRLVSKSLVMAEGNDRTRYRLLETIRDYARAKLCPDEAGRLGDRHAGCFTTMAESTEQDLTGSTQAVRLRELTDDYDNLRSALRWWISRNRPDEARRLAAGLVLFWRMRSHFNEGLEEIARVLALGPGGPDTVRAKLEWGRGLLASMIGDYTTARAAGQASLKLYERLGDRRGHARALLLVGTCELMGQGPEASVPVLQKAIALARQVDDPWCLAHALALCGSSFNQQGDVAAARPVLEECVLVARRARDDQCLVAGLSGLGYVALCQGDYDDAEANLRAALETSNGMRAPYETTAALTDLAHVALGRNDLDAARRLLDEAEGAARTVASADAMTYVLDTQGALALAENDLDGAERLFAGSLRLARGSHGISQTAVQGLGEIALARCDLATAERVLTDALELAKGSAHKRRMADAQFALAVVARRGGQDAQSLALHYQALGLRYEIGDLPGMASSLEALAGVVHQTGGAERAVRVFAAVEALRTANGYRRSGPGAADYEADLQAAQDALGAEDLERTWSAGLGLSIHDAVAQMSKGRGTRKHRPVRGWDSLTPAEQGVAQLAAQGLTNAEIGERLFVSENTVKTHLGRVLAKLNISSRRALTRRLMELST